MRKSWVLVIGAAATAAVFLVVLSRGPLFAPDALLEAEVKKTIGEARGVEPIRVELARRYRVLAFGAWSGLSVKVPAGEGPPPHDYIHLLVGECRMWPVRTSVEGFVLIDSAGSVSAIVIRRSREGL